MLAIGCGNGSSHDSVPTVAPSAQPTVTAACCPAALHVAIDGPAVDVDIGATGISYDTHFPRGLAFDLAAACDRADAGTCGSCALTDAAASLRRCFDDISRGCERDADCPTGRCVRVFSPPLPLNAGSVPSCAIDEVRSLGPRELRSGHRDDRSPADAPLDVLRRTRRRDTVSAVHRRRPRCHRNVPRRPA